MKRRSSWKHNFFALFCAVVLALSAISFHASAMETNDPTVVIIYMDDGSYLEITITEFDTRAANSKTGKKTMVNKDPDGTVNWTATLTANFTYDGSTVKINSALCTVDIVDTNWYVAYNSTLRSGGTATTTLKMSVTYDGTTVATYPYTISLTCDVNGNLS